MFSKHIIFFHYEKRFFKKKWKKFFFVEKDKKIAYFWWKNKIFKTPHFFLLWKKSFSKKNEKKNFFCWGHGLRNVRANISQTMSSKIFFQFYFWKLFFIMKKKDVFWKFCFFTKNKRFFCLFLPKIVFSTRTGGTGHFFDTHLMIKVVADIKTFPTHLIWALYVENWLSYSNTRVSTHSIYEFRPNFNHL